VVKPPSVRLLLAVIVVPVIAAGVVLPIAPGIAGLNAAVEHPEAESDRSAQAGRLRVAAPALEIALTKLWETAPPPVIEVRGAVVDANNSYRFPMRRLRCRLALLNNIGLVARGWIRR
jgi:hypothetical protein